MFEPGGEFARHLKAPDMFWKAGAGDAANAAYSEALARAPHAAPAVPFGV